MANLLYSWKFSSKKERSTTRYIIALSIIIWLVIWWFLSKLYWMSLIVLLASWVMYFIENNSEDEINVEINDNWIKISSSFYDYWRINSFTILYSWEYAIFLRLNINNKWFKKIDLVINNDIVNDIRNILLNYLEENPKEELSFSDKIINLLKL